MSVLVTDGNERAALAVTRALGLQKIKVVIGAETERSLAGQSRYSAASFQYPSPYEDPERFVNTLLGMVVREKFDMLVPISDLAMQLIAERRDEFDQHTIIPAPQLSAYEAVSDKYRLMKRAQQLGVPIPDTLFVENGCLPCDLTTLGEFPLVVKPSRSRVTVDGTWSATTVHHVASQRELEQLYQDTRYLRQPSLIQKRVEGEGQGIFALCDRGTPLVLFAHRRLREKPPSGGVSVLRESMELPKAMTEHAVRLLQDVKWHGVAMVEFKVERRTGIPRLMEINGRFWGSLQLALDAGVNFPFQLYRLVHGQNAALSPGEYRVGVKSRWLLGDLDHLLLRVFKPDSTLRLSPEYPSRLRCIMEFFRFFEHDVYYEIERREDFRPALHQIACYLKTLVRGEP